MPSRVRRPQDGMRRRQRFRWRARPCPQRAQATGPHTAVGAVHDFTHSVAAGRHRWQSPLVACGPGACRLWRLFATSDQDSRSACGGRRRIGALVGAPAGRLRQLRQGASTAVRLGGTIWGWKPNTSRLDGSTSIFTQWSSLLPLAWLSPKVSRRVKFSRRRPCASSRGLPTPK